MPRANPEGRCSPPAGAGARGWLWGLVVLLGCTAGPQPPGPQELRESLRCGGAPCVEALGAGAYRTCARRRDGVVACWGNNVQGQLLDGTVEDRPWPVGVAGLQGVAQVALGAVHTCARREEGTVWCWGANAAGQLGVGRTGGKAEPPAQVLGLTEVVEVAAGDNHTCARRAEGTVWCWGANESGQLGEERGVRLRAEPTRLAGVEGAVRLAVGSRHTCVLLAGGEVRCWGWRPELSAQRVEGATGLAVGGLFACAWERGGGVWCWGQNDQGQLGNGRRSELGEPLVVVPVRVVGLEGVAEVTVSRTHACARREEGTVWCWGSSWTGEVGDGLTGVGEARVVPTKLEGLGRVVQVVAGGSCWPSGGAHTCALGESGEVWCWGDNASGQLGDGTLEQRGRPVKLEW